MLIGAAQFLSAATVVGSNFTLAIQPWQTYLFFLAISSFAILLNVFGYRILGQWNRGACMSSPMYKSPVIVCALTSCSILVAFCLHRDCCHDTCYLTQNRC